MKVIFKFLLILICFLFFISYPSNAQDKKAVLQDSSQYDTTIKDADYLKDTSLLKKIRLKKRWRNNADSTPPAKSHFQLKC